MLYRAFFALPKTITDDRKRPVNALLGAINMMLQVVAEHDPRAVVFCFGPDAAVYRVELYPPYHADRPPVPDELVWQLAAGARAVRGARVEHRPRRRRSRPTTCSTRSPTPSAGRAAGRCS